MVHFGVTRGTCLQQEFGGNLTTALCAVDVPGQGWVSGYQLSAGAAACTVAVNGSATVSTAYACGCVSHGQEQGLAPPDAANGESCESACGQVWSLRGVVLRWELKSRRQGMQWGKW